MIYTKDISINGPKVMAQKMLQSKDISCLTIKFWVLKEDFQTI
jgi:hypothetical protein